jgi:hypothetical protein
MEFAMRHTLIVFTAASVLLSGVAWADAKKIQCWTDDKGHRSCGDYVPPQFAQKEVQILNKHGMVVDTRQRERTAEEAAADVLKAQEEKQAAERARKQAAYDRFLLDTYSNAKELEKARDIRVKTLDGRIMLAEKAVGDNQATLADLRSRVPKALDADPKKAAMQAKNNDRLKKQIETFENTLADNTKAITVMKQERETTVAKFEEDIQRWQILKSQGLSAPAAAPAATR